MAEFTQVRKKGPAAKYPEHQQTLLEMGFEAIDVSAALETVSGNIEFAMALLLGEPIPSVMGGSYTSRVLPPMKVVGKSQSSSTALKSLNKPDIKEVHSKFMASYKILKCKEKNSHDKRMCVGYHTKGDRRRNPFEIPYACTECPTSPTETTNCPDGDACLKAHNMLERMFHPELFKISMCQRGPNGSHCERGNLCAFAHSDEDHRIPLSHTLNKAAQLAAIASEPLVAGKSMGDSRMLDSVQDKLIRLIKSQGTEGIISSELPKRFSDVYSERLDLTDEAGEKFRIKDLLLAHPCISVTMHKGVQPKYVWGEERYSSAPIILATPIAPIVDIAIAPKPVATVSLSTMKPATSWASAVSSPAPAPVPAPAAVSIDGDISVRGRRRGPSSVPSSNHSLEVSDGQSPLLNPIGTFSTEGSLFPSDGIVTFEGTPEFTGLNPSSSVEYLGAPIGFGSLPPAPGLTGLLGTSFGTAPPSVGPPPRRRGPSGPTDDLSMSFLGAGVGAVAPFGLAVPAAQSSPKVPPGFSSTSSTSSPRGEVGSSLDFEKRLNHSNNVCNALQTQVNNLQGDLIQKSRELDKQNLELQESVRRLHLSEETNTDTETKDSLSVEILKFRTELFATQQLLRQRDEELAKTKEALKECETALKIAENSKNLMIPELHNTRAKLSAAEQDFENSRSHYAELDRSRNMLQSELESLRSQLGGSARIGPSAAEVQLQLQQMNQALSQSHREREGLLNYIKMSQQRQSDENSMNEHSRARFGDSSNGYLHQPQISSNNGWDSHTDDYTNQSHVHGNHLSMQQQQQNLLQGNYISNADKVCSFPGCSLEGKYLCVCQVTRYCGTPHQREHWDFHQSECRPAKR